MLLTIALFLATALFGGGLFVLTGKRGMDNLDLILAFGGAFVIAMCFLHPWCLRRLQEPRRLAFMLSPGFCFKACSSS